MDSRVSDVDPRVDLMEVFGGPAVEAAVVRQQLVELLESHLEARHVESLRSRCLHLLAVFVLHNRRNGEMLISCRLRPEGGGRGGRGGGKCGGQVSVYRSAPRAPPARLSTES